MRSFASFRSINALILREIATSYGRSPGGYIWALLEPIAGIALLTLVFSVSFHAPALGINFPLFYATGMLPFMMFTHLSNKVAQSIEFSRPLLAYPAVTWLDAICARFSLNLVTSLLVGLAIFSGILSTMPTRTALDLAAILEAYSLAAVLGLGIGTMNCLIQGLFPVWVHVWSILMRPMFLISCIFFTFETIPENFRTWLWFNPLIHVIGIMRRGFYPQYDAAYANATYVGLLALVCLSAGMFFLRPVHRQILNR